MLKKFRIEGLDRQTGKACVDYVDATSEREVVLKLGKEILVERVTALSGSQDSPKVVEKFDAKACVQRIFATAGKSRLSYFAIAFLILGLLFAIAGFLYAIVVFFTMTENRDWATRAIETSIVDELVALGGVFLLVTVLFLMAAYSRGLQRLRPSTTSTLIRQNANAPTSLQPGNWNHQQWQNEQLPKSKSDNSRIVITAVRIAIAVPGAIVLFLFLLVLVERQDSSSPAKLNYVPTYTPAIERYHPDALLLARRFNITPTFVMQHVKFIQVGYSKNNIRRTEQKILRDLVVNTEEWAANGWELAEFAAALIVMAEQPKR